MLPAQKLQGMMKSPKFWGFVCLVIKNFMGMWFLLVHVLLFFSQVCYWLQLFCARRRKFREFLGTTWWAWTNSSTVWPQLGGAFLALDFLKDSQQKQQKHVKIQSLQPYKKVGFPTKKQRKRVPYGQNRWHRYQKGRLVKGPTVPSTFQLL